MLVSSLTQTRSMSVSSRTHTPSMSVSSRTHTLYVSLQSHTHPLCQSPVTHTPSMSVSSPTHTLYVSLQSHTHTHTHTLRDTHLSSRLAPALWWQAHTLTRQEGASLSCLWKRGSGEVFIQSHVAKIRRANV